MHKTIGLIVATIGSLGAGAAIIWQTEQGWNRSLAGSRSPASESDLYDAIPVDGKNSSSLLASNNRLMTNNEKPANPANFASNQDEPESPPAAPKPAKQSEPAPTNAFDLWANQSNSQTEPAPTNLASNPPADSKDPWNMGGSPTPASNNNQFEPVPKKEVEQPSAPNDPWGMSNVTPANHEQPASKKPADVQLTQHEKSEPVSPNGAAADPFMSFGNAEPAPVPAATADPFNTPPSPAEQSNVSSLFPDEPAPSPAPVSTTAATQNEPGAFPSFGAFPEPAPATTAPAQPTASPMFPDLAPAPAPAATNPIRLTQAEEPPVPPADEMPPAPIPMLEEPKPSTPPGNAEPAGPAPDPFFDFGGQPPAPANEPTPVPMPGNGTSPAPAPVPFPNDPAPAPAPSTFQDFMLNPAPPTTLNPTEPVPTNPTPVPAPNSLFPETSTPAPNPLDNPPPANPIERPLTEDSMIGAGVINGNVPRVLQRPELSLEKKAPTTAALGEAMVYTIEVKNTGTITAKDVTLEDEIPKGSKLTGTIPQAHMKEKTLVWKLGDMKPGDSQLVKVRVIPLEEGDIGSVATVHFVTEVAAATRITAPILQLAMEATPQVAIGEDATIRYKIKNVGEGTAFNVTLYSLIPQNLKHPEGVDLEMPIGTLEAGQSKDFALVAVAEAAGRGINQAQVKANGGVTADGKADIEVIDSVLNVERTGPARRFVGHNASYTITVINQSIRDIDQATIVERVPTGFEFVSATANGKYNPSTRSVAWNFGKLRAKTQESMQITLRPDRVGEFNSEVAVVSKDGHKASVAAKTIVEGFASLKIEDPEGKGLVGIGEQVSLRFKVRNRGSAPANGVQITCNVPANFQVLSAKGPTEYRQEGNRLIFDPVNAIAPEQDMQVDFVLVAKAVGDAHLSIAVNAQEMKDSLNHEENIVVYNPNE
ncbi:hypothetical protein [Lacunimicrobium album]